MATGDLKNNLRKLQAELRAVKYDKDVDFESLGNGLTAAYLPIYHYVFVDYSRPLAEKIAGMEIELFGKTDLRFMEAVYKVLREMFSYKPAVTKDQFFAAGFGERKVIMCTQIVQLLRQKHQSVTGVSRSASSARVHANQTMPCSTNSASCTDHEVASRTRLTDSVASADATSEFASPAIFSRVVNETRPTMTNGFAAADLRSSATGVMRQLCSSPDETTLPTVVREPAQISIVREPAAMAQNVNVVREPAASVGAASGDAATAIQNAVLSAVNKINATVQQLGSRLNTLDDRLAQLESLERRLTEFSELNTRYAEFSRLERRVTHLEHSVHVRSASPASAAVNPAGTANVGVNGATPDLTSSPATGSVKMASMATNVLNAADAMTGQLNNLSARMILAENKLTMLQAQSASTCRGLFPSPESCAAKKSFTVETGANGDINHRMMLSASHLNSALLAPEAVGDDSDAIQVVDPTATVDDMDGAVDNTSERSSRTEQLSRIQAMLRGTKELLNIQHNDSLSEPRRPLNF